HKDGTFHTPVQRAGALQVWLQPERPAGIPAESVTIRDGQDAPEAVFEVALDSDALSFRPRRQSVSVRLGEASPPLRFPCAVPKQPAEYEVWVQVFQSNDLIQVLRVALRVDEKGDPV